MGRWCELDCERKGRGKGSTAGLIGERAWQKWEADVVEQRNQRISKTFHGWRKRGGGLPWMASAITGNEEGRRKGVIDVQVPRRSE